ncbi:MAG: hypothetical protein KatS3mg101_0642 [Patescibacteria group bacterium]|nr:MAG: hypothetical protein KatS3mg101_0642 [Patescibacteria group bacterium]
MRFGGEVGENKPNALHAVRNARTVGALMVAILIMKKNHDYDDPSRGVLECLWCHLKRHAELYYKYAYNRDKRRLRDTKYACLALINRILAGEDIYNRGPQIRSRADIKQARKEIVALLNEVYKEQRKKVGRSDRAKEKFEELVNMAR